MIKDWIKPFLPIFKTARNTIINNPDNNLDNLTWNNICLTTIKQNKHQLSLFKPDNIELKKWNSTLQYHIVAKLKKDKMAEAQAKAQTEATQAAANEQAKQEAENEQLKLLLGGTDNPEEKMKIYSLFHEMQQKKRYGASVSA